MRVTAMKTSAYRHLCRLFASLARPRAGVLAAAVLGASLAGCGLPDDLVVVHVNGLETAITELRVTLTLDGATAKNSMPTVDSPDTGSFAVYKDMRRFGVQVPGGTRTLGVTVEGLNTARVTVRVGSASVDLSQTHDATVAIERPQ